MTVFASLQSKLIGAFVALAVVSLIISGAVFLRLRQDNQRQLTLDRVAAETGPIYARFLLQQLQGDSLEALSEYTRQAAHSRDVRMLLIDRDRLVVTDTGGKLTGKELQLVSAGMTVAGSTQHPFSAFEVRGGSGESGMLLLGPARELMEAQPFDASVSGSLIPELRPADGVGSPRSQARPRPTVPYQLVFVVPESDFTQGWLGLLPNLGVAAAVTFPVAVLLAILFARYITRPLRGLTAATAEVAAGRFDIDVPAANRRDEVGQLATAFAGMTRRVGESQGQVRSLIADVSHNLKTPLTPILGFSRAIASGHASEPADVQRMGAVIQEEAERLASRLDDLLYLGELESGSAILQLAPANLSELVLAATARVLGGPMDGRSAITIEPDIVATVDSGKLERAIENLLDNARRYSPPDSAITVALGRSAGMVRLVVENEAPGLDAAELPRLFDRFYRSRSANGWQQPGSGLGLPIARDIARLHGGALDARVERGRLALVLTLNVVV